MSGALPNTDFTAYNIKSNQKTLISETDSGKTFRRQVQGQRWSFTISYPPMTRSDFAPIMAFIIKQRSRKETFTITFPSYLNALGRQVIEAGFYKKPSIVCLRDSKADCFINNKTGIRFKNKGDVKQLINSIKFFYFNRSKINFMGKNAFKLVNRNYNVKKNLNKLENLYTDLV